MAKVERRKHSEAFKRRIVKLVLKGTRNVEEIAAAHELSPSMLHNWKRDPRYGGDPMRFPSSSNASARLGTSLPQKPRANGALKASASEKRWKFCPNCGERLK